MAPAYLLDENQRGVLWRALQRHNAMVAVPLEVVRVGDPPDLPLGSSDLEVLIWAEANDRILVSRDKRTLGSHLHNHVATGHHSPGIFILRRGARVRDVVAFLVEVARADEPGEWRDQIEYIP
jgi:hypothetical protein